MPRLKAKIVEWFAKFGLFDTGSIRAYPINGKTQFWQ
jgi:hypothetical protein